MPEKMKPVIWYLEALARWIHSFGHNVVIRDGVCPDLLVCNIRTTETMIVRMFGRKFYATSPALWDFAIDAVKDPIFDGLLSFRFVFRVGPRQVENHNGAHVYYAPELEKDDLHVLGDIIGDATGFDTAVARDKNMFRYLIVVLPHGMGEVEIIIRQNKFVATRVVPGLGNFFQDFGSNVGPYRYQLLI